MTSGPDDRLHAHLAAMVAFEMSVQQRAAEILDGAAHPEVVALGEGLRAASAERAAALRARLERVAPEVAVPEPCPAPSVLDSLYDAGRYPASAALVALHALLSQAVLGYAVLIELAFRAADSVEHLGEDNTGDLAWEHLRACARAVPEVLRVMPYVVADELEAEGQDCRCTCPTCGLGVCGCVLAFRRRLDLASAEAGPIERWPGITLVRPREGSPAALAGLCKGDVVHALGGTEIDSIPLLQETITGVEPGTALGVRVTRAADGREETVEVVRA